MPFKIREKLEAPNRYEVRREIENVLKNFEGRRISVLDAGAGDCFAGKFFTSHEYVSMDIEKNKESRRDLDVIGSVEKIPSRPSEIPPTADS